MQCMGANVSLRHALPREYGSQNWKELKNEVLKRSTANARALEEVKRQLRDQSVKARMHAFREYTIWVHPNWTGIARFGWGLACTRTVCSGTRVKIRSNKLLEQTRTTAALKRDVPGPSGRSTRCKAISRSVPSSLIGR